MQATHPAFISQTYESAGRIQIPVSLYRRERERKSERDGYIDGGERAIR